MRWLGAHRLVPVVGLAAAVAVAGCSVNPATGKRQLSLIGESQEIALGRESDPSIVASFGLVDDPELQAYVHDLGTALAQKSERPDLPWTFRLLDDPLVNAFALPGGFIYVTRGIMAHLESEAELAGVLGHEIGHVTARHSVNQMSKAMVAQVGLVAGAVFAPEAAQSIGGLAQTAAQLLFLKFGRDDERQSDALAVRYTVRERYDPNALLGVFDTLGRVSQAAGAGGVPGWASTHPSPADRRQRIAALIDELGNQIPRDLRREHEAYLRRLEGMVYGNNPREGFFRGSSFFHPEMAFRLDFPSGWQTQNTRQAVSALDADRNAMIQLTLSQAASPEEAAAQFVKQQGVIEGRRWERPVRGLASTGRVFGVENDGQRVIDGYAVFVELDDRVFQLLAFARSAVSDRYAEPFRSALQSFQRVRDRAILDVQPQTLEIVRASRTARFRDLPEIARADVPLERLALLNRFDADETVEGGTWIKTVRGVDPSAGAGR